MKILLMTYAATDTRLVTRLASSLSDFFGCAVDVAPSVRREPDNAHDKQRGQSRSGEYLKELGARNSDQLEPIAIGEAASVLGITSTDLFVPRLNFVFGEADRKRRAAIVSTYRLRPELYGEPDDPDLLFDRLLKEAVHETGHVLGLDHCSQPGCVMQYSQTVADTDAKGPGYCSLCEARLKG